MGKEPKPDDPAQSKRFIDAAREAEADETEEGAARAFGRVARKGISRPQGTGSAGSRENLDRHVNNELNGMWMFAAMAQQSSSLYGKVRNQSIAFQ